MKSERWAVPAGFSRYEASAAGLLRRNGVLLHATADRDGRRSVVVIGDDGRRRNKAVAALVLLAFRGPPPSPDAARVVYRDGDNTNDRLGNVAWGTRAEQRAKMRWREPVALTDAQVRRAHAMMAGRDWSLRRAAADLGVSRVTLVNAFHRLSLDRPRPRRCPA